MLSNLISIKQLTKITGVNQNELNRVIRLMNVPTTILSKRKQYLDTYSQELLFKHLKDTRISKVEFEFIVLPSKMNKPTPEYSREEFIKKGYLERN